MTTKAALALPFAVLGLFINHPVAAEEQCADNYRVVAEGKKAFAKESAKLAPLVKSMTKKNADVIGPKIPALGLMTEGLIQVVIDADDCYSTEAVERHREMLAKLRSGREGMINP